MQKSVTFFTGGFKRMFKLLPPVQNVGFLPRKTNMIDMSFNSCNFSFIFGGTGKYILQGKKYEIDAPCMLLQWPTEPMHYGPDTWWNEMFFIYSGETFSEWKNSKLFEPDNPVRRMYNISAVQQKAMMLYEMLSGNMCDGDKLDLFCYTLIIDTFIDENEQLLSNTLIPDMRKYMERSLGGDIDLKTMAKKFNMSVSALRRYYRKYCGGETFSQYRDNIFLRRSCKLLQESDMTIKAIAEELQFSDQYYFSRKFHALSGRTPMEYRKLFGQNRKKDI